jgi:leucyl-tRNA synthetase
MKKYNHTSLEKKIAKIWDTEEVYKTQNSKSKKPAYYVLDMFPYPSGAGLHVGHPRGYIASDIFARKKRMEGYNVLHPVGFDSFGLPAEQYAIKTGKHPGPFTKELIKTYKKQLGGLGFSYDWSREVSTHTPEYYKYTQEIFLSIYNSWYDTALQKARPIFELVAILSEKGNKSVNAYTNPNTPTITAKEWNAYSKKEQQDFLMNYRLAYEGYAEVNWCPEMATVLANDEVITKADGSMVSERGEHPVEKKSMRQWFMRITAYAERLLSGLDTLDWPESGKTIQRNWIGKSEGSEIDFAVEGTTEKITVFTTRADTLFGVTYVVLAPDHALVSLLDSQIQNKDEVANYIAETLASQKALLSGEEVKEKTGIVLEGVYATNPANGERVPVWLANYVLSNYGTGAVMAVPAHDERDFEFAKKYSLPIKKVVRFNPFGDYINNIGVNTYFGKSLESTDIKTDCYIGVSGELVNSEKFNGLKIEKAKKEITKFVKGRLVTKYRMRDAIFARQRYWGEPIPLYRDSEGIIHEVSKKDLPLLLPKLKSFAPSGTGESPLANSKEWVKAGYETNTMPGWAGSSWYFMRYADAKNEKELAAKSELEYFGAVDMYVGGAEHYGGHLFYARFWTKVLHDLGTVPYDEPFKALRNQGLIGGTDGRKMSKRYGNIINPDDVIATYGADTLRVYESFMGPFEAHLPWSTENIMGARRFVDRVYRAHQRAVSEDIKKSSEATEKILHKTIQKVGSDIEAFGFNTAVSSMMILLNTIESQGISKKDWKVFLQILAPFAPFITDTLWREMGEKKSIHISAWPSYDEAKLLVDEITIGVQVNGKLRGEITISRDESEEVIKERACALESVQKFIGDTEIKKVIYVAGRIVSIVV